ncbi:MAG: cytochrome P450, partial [Sphingomonadales bacterium]
MAGSGKPSEGANDFEIFDHREAAHLERAPCLWSRMRQSPTLPHSSNYGGFYIATRFDDVEAITRNHEVFSSASGISFPALDFGIPLIPAEVDPPLHNDYRGLLARFFTRKYVEALEPTFRQMARDLLDGFQDRSRVDFVDVFARPLPVYVSLELMGLPREDAPYLDGLVHDLHKARGTKQGARAAQAFQSYLETKLIQHEKVARDPAESVLSAVVLGEVQGRRMTLEERTSMIRLLLFGGFDTTSISLATAMWWLATHP